MLCPHRFSVSAAESQKHGHAGLDSELSGSNRGRNALSDPHLHPSVRNGSLRGTSFRGSPQFGAHRQRCPRRLQSRPELWHAMEASALARNGICKAASSTTTTRCVHVRCHRTSQRALWALGPTGVRVGSDPASASTKLWQKTYETTASPPESSDACLRCPSPIHHASAASATPKSR